LRNGDFENKLMKIWKALYYCSDVCLKTTTQTSVTVFTVHFQ